MFLIIKKRVSARKGGVVRELQLGFTPEVEESHLPILCHQPPTSIGIAEGPAGSLAVDLWETDGSGSDAVTQAIVIGNPIQYFFIKIL
ncbi:hypothetical protein MRB53_019631 [Persea americana]|uniref:Uncharacterized protein n=1 Tax=Persea americana TaxID=3435 RepID=A0ACC2KZU2_PERAE|nr:hypothetical protein MRB53_019631 [Persea americana]